MGPVRRTINLIIALALFAAAWGGLVFLLFFAARFYVWMLIATVTVGTLAAYWIWADYINADPRSER